MSGVCAQGLSTDSFGRSRARRGREHPPGRECGLTDSKVRYVKRAGYSDAALGCVGPPRRGRVGIWSHLVPRPPHRDLSIECKILFCHKIGRIVIVLRGVPRPLGGLRQDRRARLLRHRTLCGPFPSLLAEGEPFPFRARQRRLRRRCPPPSLYPFRPLFQLPFYRLFLFFRQAFRALIAPHSLFLLFQEAPQAAIRVTVSGCNIHCGH